MRRLSYLLALALMVLTIPSVALASDISQAIYSGTIVVSNNSTATTNVRAAMTLHTPDLIDRGYVNSSVNNVAVVGTTGADVPFMPGGTDNSSWFLWVPSIGGNTQYSNILYTGGNQTMNGDLAYFPGAAGMTAADNATMELGNNFEIEQTGYVDTSASAIGSNLVLKDGAFRLWVSGVGAITSGIATATENWSAFTSANTTGWTNGANIIDGDTGTFGDISVGVTSWSNYVTANMTAADVSRFRYWYTTAGLGTITNMEIDAYVSGAWVNVFTGAPAAVGAWRTQTFTAVYVNAQMRVRFYNSSGANSVTVQLHEIQPGDLEYLTVTVSGVTSGEHTVITGADGMNLYMIIDP